MIVAMVVLILLGGHVAAVLGITGIAFATISGRFDLIALFPDRFYTIMTSFSLEAVPLFVFMGAVLEKVGVAEKVYGSLYLLMGRLPGSLLLATTVFSIIFGACTGILGAIIVTMGLIALPAMLKANYSKELACGTICAGGSLGLVIPPSIMLILYGPSAGVSIAELFFACLIPGVSLGFLYLIYILVACSLNAKLAPSLPQEKREVITAGDKLKMIASSILPTFGLVVAVLGSILFGIASPTEAAAVGAVGALVLAIIYRKLNWENLRECCWSTTKITAFIMFIVIGAGVFTTVFMGLGSGDMVIEFILGLKIGKLGTMTIILGIIFILGMFMDWIGILLVFVPLSMPVVKTLGIDPLWFGTLFCLVLTISCITPPFAYTAFYLKGISPPEVSLGDIYRGMLPFVFIQIVIVAIVYRFPAMCTWLPRLM
jgi:tripartite ATP-independent transporter DctM subunit